MVCPVTPFKKIWIEGLLKVESEMKIVDMLVVGALMG
jgi:hypothetical protein